MARRFVREQLLEGHRVSAFRCGNADLDRWLVESAATAGRRDYSRTYVWVGASSGTRAFGPSAGPTAADEGLRDELGEVVAYFTLSGFAIARSAVPGRLSRGEYRVIPALLLGKLALDQSLHRRGYGRILLADAVVEAVRASRLAAARYLVVDAVDPHAAKFYRQFGFASVTRAGSGTGAGAEPGADGLVGGASEVAASRPLRMVARMRDLEAALS